MKILVTGATGHLGSVVIQTLLKKISSKQNFNHHPKRRKKEPSLNQKDLLLF